MSMLRTRHLAPVVLGFSLLNLCACTTDDDEKTPLSFVMRNASHSVAATTPMISDGSFMAYLASESTTGPGGTDLNGDSDVLDSVAVVVNSSTNSTRVTSTAARRIEFVNGTLLLEVLESADGRDWNGDLDMTDVVLLSYVFTDLRPTFLAELSTTADPAVAKAGDRLFYVTPTAPVAEFDTNLAFAQVSSRGAVPDAPVAIISNIDDLMDDGVSVSLGTAVGDILVLLMDETVEGELNGDGDALDTRVMGALDAGALAPLLVNLALTSSSDTAVAAVERGSDWLVTMLVDESGQGINLNDPALFSAAWVPLACAGRADTDMLDNVPTLVPLR